MNNELTTPNFNTEQMHLITSVIAKGATPDELKLFLYRCQNLGLDPLKPGQIYFIKYGTGPGTIVVGIEGFRARAAKTGKLSGIKRGALRGDKGELIGAFAEVYRCDWDECAREEVPLAEYNTGKGNWAKMPETMIKKVAEAAALRMAFPDDLGGFYTQEEMDQAQPRGVFPQQPETVDGNQDADVGGYRVPFGKYAKRSLEEIEFKELMNYVLYLESKSKKENKPLTGAVADFVERASDYIHAVESGGSPTDESPPEVSISPAREILNKLAAPYHISEEIPLPTDEGPMDFDAQEAFLPQPIPTITKGVIIPKGTRK